MRPSSRHEETIALLQSRYPQLQTGSKGNKNERRRTALLKLLRSLGDESDESELPILKGIPDLWAIDMDKDGDPRLLLVEVVHTSPVTYRKICDYSHYAMILRDGLDISGPVTELWVFDAHGRMIEKYHDGDFDYISVYADDKVIVEDYRARRIVEQFG